MVAYLISEQAWRIRIEKYTEEMLPVFKEALCNEHYEGDVKGKATLNIVSIGELSASAYTGAWADSSWPDLAPTTLAFNIDQQETVRFRVQTVTQLTTQVNLLDEGTKKAVYAMQIVQDGYIASLYTEISSNLYGAASGVAWSGGQGRTTGTGPITIGFASNGNEVLPSVALSTMQQMLADANADQSDPAIVIPPWFGDYLHQELGTRYTGMGDASVRGGVKPGLMEFGGAVEGWNNIYISNNISNTGQTLYKIMGGTPASSITFASALEEAKSVELQNDFGTGTKMLFVYDALIPFETHMVLGTLNRGTPRFQLQ